MTPKYGVGRLTTKWGNDMGPIEQLSHILPACTKVVDRIQVMQMNDPTPCEKFTVLDVLDHMMVLGGTFSYLFRGEQTPELAPSGAYGWVPAKEFHDVMDDLAEAIASPGALERTMETPLGTMDGETFARLIAFDGLVHGWDLATATGQRLELPAEVVETVAAFAHGALSDDMRDGDTFKQPTDAGPSAGAIEQLAAFSGRTVPVAG
jgi:uncharacterized protein (TIGR03086 family)